MDCIVTDVKPACQAYSVHNLVKGVWKLGHQAGVRVIKRGFSDRMRSIRLRLVVI